MENTDSNEPVIPIAQPQPAVDAPQADGASAMMKRFDAMKAAEAPPAPVPPKDEPPAKPDAEPAPNTPEPPATPEQPPKEKLKWGELKAKATRADELEAKLPTMEKELADLREKASKVADTSHFEKQIADKEKAIADYERKVAIFDVRESKAWKEEVITPMSKIGTDMDRLAATYGVSAVELKEALTITDPKAQMERINQLTGDMTDLHKNKVWTAVERTQELYDKAHQIESNATEAKKELDFLQHQETEKQKQVREKELKLAAETVQKQYLEKLPFLFEDEAMKQKIFGADMSLSDSPQWRAYRAYAGEIVPVLNAKLQTAQARVTELEDELAKRAALGVKAGGGGAPTSVPVEKPNGQYEGNSVWERSKAAAAAGHITLAPRRGL